MRIRIPTAARLQQFEGFSRRVEDADDPDLAVELPSTYFFLHPMALAGIAAAGLRARAAGAEVSFGQIPTTNSVRYLARMGLFRMLGLNPEVDVTEHEEAGRFIPLRMIRTGAELSAFVADLAPLFHARQAGAEPVQYVVSELVRNTIEHAGSRAPAVVAAQVFRSGAVGIGVADCGQGIRTSLQQSYPTSSDLEAVMLSLRPGITGTTTKPGGSFENAGAGLFFCKSIALSGRQYMVVHSDTGFFKLKTLKQGVDLVLHADAKEDHATTYAQMAKWPGTLVGTDIDVNAFDNWNGYLEYLRAAYRVDVRAATSAKYKKKALFT